MTSLLDAPFPEDWTVGRARDAYLAENGFTVAAYDERWTEGTVFGLTLAVPNTARHRWAIMLHDLHHVATGYGTDSVGEGELAVWELARKRWGLGLYVGAIVFFGAAFYGPLSPRRMLAAIRAARATRSLHALYGGVPSAAARDAVYAELLELSVGELRERLAVPRGGIVGRRALHEKAPRAESDAVRDADGARA